MRIPAPGRDRQELQGARWGRSSWAFRPGVRGGLLAAAFLALCGCGPTAREAGTAVLCAAPLALIGGLLLLSLLLRLWRRRYPELSLRLLPNLCLLVALANGAVARAWFDWKSTEWTWVALWWFGTSFAAVLLLVWRIWFRIEPRGSFTWSALPAMLLFVAPAIYLAFEGSTASGPPDWIVDLWVWPGYLGYVPGGMFLILLIEAAIRGRAPKPLADEPHPG